MLKNNHKLWLIYGVTILVLLGGLLLRLCIILQPLPFLATHGPLIDDSFIYFTLARNIASGEGIVFEGETPTSGYQPLWLFICALSFFLFPSPEMAIRVILFGEAVAAAVVAGLFFLFFRRRRLVFAGLLCCSIWSLNPFVTRQVLNGLETSLQLLFLIALLYVLEYVTDEKAPGWSCLMWSFLAVLPLCRVDMIFFWPGIFLFLLRKKYPLRKLVKNCLAASLPLGLWCTCLFVSFGSIVPESGKAVRLLSLLYGTKFSFFTDSLIAPKAIPLSYYVSNLMYSLATGDRYILSVLYPLFTPLKIEGDLPQSFVLFPGFLTLSFLVLFVFALRFYHFTSMTGIIREKVVFLPAAIMSLAAYSFWIFGQWFYHRYYFFLFPAIVVMFSVLLSFLLHLPRAEWKRNTLKLMLLFLIIVSFAHHSRAYLRPSPNPVHYYQVSQEIRRQIPSNLRIGCFQSGMISFFLSEYQVICLDGVVNGSARIALEEARIDEYIELRGIQVIVDWDWIMQKLLVPRSQNSEYFGEWEKIPDLHKPFSGLKRREFSRDS